MRLRPRADADDKIDVAGTMQMITLVIESWGTGASGAMAVDAPTLAVTAHVARRSAADMREACDKALPAYRFAPALLIRAARTDSRRGDAGDEYQIFRGGA